MALALSVLPVGIPTRADTGAEAAPEKGYLEGRLLVATRAMSDPRFVETVIYLVEHNAEGALGLVLNRLLGVGPVADLMQSLGIDSDAANGDIRIHYGGPVQPQLGFVLHSTDYVREETVIVNSHVGFTANAEILRDIAEGDGPRQSLFALGYAGWGPGQLEAEIEVEAWVSVPADNTLIFDKDLESKWKRALAKRGIDL